jgi:Tfp pilus assembly protein PilF
VHTDLAEAYLANKQPDDAKKETLAALEIAPSYERAQDLLLQVVGTGK